MLPDSRDDHTLVLDYSRLAFVKKTTNVGFVDGIPKVRADGAQFSARIPGYSKRHNRSDCSFASSSDRSAWRSASTWNLRYTVTLHLPVRADHNLPTPILT